MILGGIGQFFPIGLLGFNPVPSETLQLTLGDSQSVIVGCYVIIFGAGQPL